MAKLNLNVKTLAAMNPSAKRTEYFDSGRERYKVPCSCDAAEQMTPLTERSSARVGSSARTPRSISWLHNRTDLEVSKVNVAVNAARSPTPLQLNAGGHFAMPTKLIDSIEARDERTFR